MISGMRKGKRLCIKTSGQCPDLFTRCCPACAEANDKMVRICRLPAAVKNPCFVKLFQYGIRKYKELLIGRGGNKERNVSLPEHRFQFFGPFDGVFCNPEIKIVGKKCIKLDTIEPPFSEECTMLLYHSYKLSWCIVLCENDRLAAKCADFGSANVKDIGKCGNIRKSDIG